MNRDGQLNAADILLLQKQLLQVWLGVGAPSSGAIAVRQIQWPYRLQTKPVFLDWLITPAHAVPANSGLLMYVHNDPLGTPQVMTDESGALVWAAQYDPFGKAAVNEDPDGDGSLVTLNVRFPGQYYDQETELHYNYFRYYDPGTGRYLTSDPIGLEGGLNTYAYVGGNPLVWSDSLGLAGSNVGNPRPPNNRSNRNRYESPYGKPGTSGLNPTPELIQNRDAQKALDSIANLLDPGSQNTASFYPPDIPFTECRRWRCPNPPGMCPPFVDVIGPILVGSNNPCVCVEKRRRWQGRNWDGSPRP
jgi:RHS repeat-associated protein